MPSTCPDDIILSFIRTSAVCAECSSKVSDKYKVQDLCLSNAWLASMAPYKVQFGILLVTFKGIDDCSCDGLGSLNTSLCFRAHSDGDKKAVI